MRYGLLADIHANLPALEAVLEVFDAEGVEAYLCAGDLVGYGPFPNECVDAVAALAPVCVAGNHDLIVLGRLSDEACIPLARDSLAWTRRALSRAARDYLAGLPNEQQVDGIVVAHGALGDPQAYTRTPEDAATQLHQLGADYPGSRILVLGHTHRAAAWSTEGPIDIADGETRELPPGPLVLNPGGVGQSRERRARARALVLDLERREATFFAVPYDVGRCRRALREAGLRSDSFHLYRSPLASVSRRLRRLAG